MGYLTKKDVLAGIGVVVFSGILVFGIIFLFGRTGLFLFGVSMFVLVKAVMGFNLFGVRDRFQRNVQKAREKRMEHLRNKDRKI